MVSLLNRFDLIGALVLMNGAKRLKVHRNTEFAFVEDKDFSLIKRSDTKHTAMTTANCQNRNVEKPFNPTTRNRFGNKSSM